MRPQNVDTVEPSRALRLLENIEIDGATIEKMRTRAAFVCEQASSHGVGPTTVTPIAPVEQVLVLDYLK